MAPTSRRLLLILAASLLLAPGRSSTHAASTRGHLYVAHYENVLGTSLEIKIIAGSSAQSQKAERAVLATIDREAHILSSWDPDSEFSRWFLTRNQPVIVSPELFHVLALFDEWRDRTDGALDASAEAIARVWKRAAGQQRLPSSAELHAAVASVHRVHWRLDPVHRTATHTSDTPLAMNSFVKSYIAGQAARAGLHDSGAQGIVVNIGGDLIVRGNWSEPVDIADPQSDAENSAPIAHLLIRNRAVATSGDYRRGFTVRGRHYSHIVDPRTGMPADEIISSTVIAADPATAGALATALSVLTPQASERLVASIPGVEYLLVKTDGQIIGSPGWSALEVAPTVREEASRQSLPRFEPVAARARLSPWDPHYELTITIELSLIEGSRVHRPYVAIWVEDEQHAPVRTIALWYGKFKYLRELRAWSRAENTRSESQETRLLNSVSSATRPPGKYTFQWDGKDDAGNAVKPGKYTVYIEAVREHGSYQLMHQEIDFDGAPQQFQLPGGVEIASATLDYHKLAQ